MVVAPVVFYGIKEVIEAPQRRADAVREEKRQELLNDLVARLGNREAAEELIKLRSEALFAHSSGDAERFAGELLKDLPKKAESYRALQDSSKQVADRLRLDWEPFLRLLLQQFDERAAALTRRGVNLKTQSNSFAVVEAMKTSRTNRLIRNVELEGGYRLNVYLLPAEVDLGKLSDTPHFWVQGITKNDVSREFINVHLTTTTIDWTLEPGSPSATRGSEPLATDPQATQFSEIVRESLNRAFEFAILTSHDTDPTGK
jgi:hypothetical protein